MILLYCILTNFPMNSTYVAMFYITNEIYRFKLDDAFRRRSIMRVSARAVANNNVINYYKFQLPIILRKYLRCNYCNVFGLSASWNIMLYIVPKLIIIVRIILLL